MKGKQILRNAGSKAWVAGLLVLLGTAGHAARPQNADIETAMAALPGAFVNGRMADGMPAFVTGPILKVGSIPTSSRAEAERALLSKLAPVLKPFRLRPEDLHLRSLRRSADRQWHFRFDQTAGSIEVIGGRLIVHVDRKGMIAAINGSARGDLPLSSAQDRSRASAVAVVLQDRRFSALHKGVVRFVYFIAPNGDRHRAYEVEVFGLRGQDAVRDKVYVDAVSGVIIAVHPQNRYAETRQVYTSNNGTSLPGTLRRSEGQASTTDAEVNAAYDNTGSFYGAFNSFFGRNSYDDAGAPLISSVHYSTGYCNAFWDGTQLVFGDGNGTSCLSFGGSVDITAHELTHAVTELESGLIYSGESGGINESLSDIFGAFVEAYTDGGSTGTLAVSDDTWRFGEHTIAPAIRYMNNPAADGSSADYYSSTVGNLDVHYSSGVGNLAFYLLSQGGVHPRGKSAVPVAGIGLDKAIRIFYEASVDYLTPNSKFEDLLQSALLATSALGYDVNTGRSVACAFLAVGVTTGAERCNNSLVSGVPMTGLADSRVGRFRYASINVLAGQTLEVNLSGSNGDADLYLRAGSEPTTTQFDCRSRLAGTNETCTLTASTTSTFWIGVRTRTAYSDASLLATVQGVPGPTTLDNGIQVGGLGGATGSTQIFLIATPAGSTLTVTASGGTGDADMYLQYGVAPTLTSYLCRPFVNGNQETCTVTSTEEGVYYVMLNGYTDYSGVSLLASWAADPGDPGALVNGAPVTSIAGDLNSTQFWHIYTPPGRKLTVTMRGGSGDADLYVRYGADPTTSFFDCRPYLVGNNEACTVSSTNDGDYYIMIRGYTSYSGVTLTASY
jgi:vibriolysin